MPALANLPNMPGPPTPPKRQSQSTSTSTFYLRDDGSLKISRSPHMSLHEACRVGSVRKVKKRLLELQMLEPSRSRALINEFDAEVPWVYNLSAP